jgi:predicted nucleic acid-binding protein
VKVLFDTNIVLDLLLARQRFVTHAQRLFAAVERQEITGYLSAHTVMTVHYLLVKQVGAKAAVAHITKLLSLFEVTALSRPVIDAALKTSFRDFEDAVLHESARLSKIEAIVTRNIADFRDAQLPVHEPTTLLALLKSKRNKNRRVDE